MVVNFINSKNLKILKLSDNKRPKNGKLQQVKIQKIKTFWVERWKMSFCEVLSKKLWKIHFLSERTFTLSIACAFA